MAGIFVCLRAFGCNIDLSVQLLVVAIRVPELVEEILKSDVYRGHIMSPVVPRNDFDCGFATLAGLGPDIVPGRETVTVSHV